MTRTTKIILIITAIAVVIAAINNVVHKYTGDIVELVNNLTQEGMQNHPERNIAGSKGNAGTIIDYVDIEWVMGEVEIQYGDSEYVSWDETYVKGSPNDYNAMRYTIDDTRLTLYFGQEDIVKHNRKQCVKHLVVTLPRDTRYQKIKVEDVNGNISVNAEAAVIAVETVNGNTTVTTGDRAQKVSMESVNGAHTLYLPSTASFIAEVEKVNGSVEIDFPNTKRNNEYTVGTAPYMEVEMETVNGKISILPAE